MGGWVGGGSGGPDRHVPTPRPANFQSTGGVIVRRDVSYAEEGGGEGPHTIGGLQSYSYWPAPKSDEARHLAAQQLWLDQHNLVRGW